MFDLPPALHDWFAAKGWSVHPHQQAMLERADQPCTLLIAPTGGGKTMAGFLPTLAELADGRHEGLHTLYISPLKALAADIKRNLRTPVEEIGLPIRIYIHSLDLGPSRTGIPGGCFVFYSGHQKRAVTVELSNDAVDCEKERFSSARCEHDILRDTANSPRHLRPSRLHDFSGGSAWPVNT